MHLRDVFFLRWIARIIFLHVLICFIAVMLIVTLPFNVLKFIDANKIPRRLIEAGQRVEIPILHDEEKGYSKTLEKHWFHVGYHGGAYRVYNDDGPGEDQSLTIFSHPSIEAPSQNQQARGVMARIVFVPDPPDDWSAVYEAYHGRSFGSALTRFSLLMLATVVTPILAIGGYFAIKGQRPKAFQRRRRSRSRRSRG